MARRRNLLDSPDRFFLSKEQLCGTLDIDKINPGGDGIFITIHEDSLSIECITTQRISEIVPVGLFEDIPLKAFWTTLVIEYEPETTNMQVNLLPEVTVNGKGSGIWIKITEVSQKLSLLAKTDHMGLIAAFDLWQAYRTGSFYYNYDDYGPEGEQYDPRISDNLGLFSWTSPLPTLCLKPLKRFGLSLFADEYGSTAEGIKNAAALKALFPQRFEKLRTRDTKSVRKCSESFLKHYSHSGILCSETPKYLLRSHAAELMTACIQLLASWHSDELPNTLTGAYLLFRLGERTYNGKFLTQVFLDARQGKNSLGILGLPDKSASSDRGIKYFEQLPLHSPENLSGTLSNTLNEAAHYCARACELAIKSTSAPDDELCVLFKDLADSTAWSKEKRALDQAFPSRFCDSINTVAQAQRLASAIIAAEPNSLTDKLDAAAANKLMFSLILFLCTTCAAEDQRISRLLMLADYGVSDSYKDGGVTTLDALYLNERDGERMTVAGAMEPYGTPKGPDHPGICEYFELRDYSRAALNKAAMQCREFLLRLARGEHPGKMDIIRLISIVASGPREWPNPSGKPC
ncbi:MAG: hypothetical protein LBP91_00110 [Coriobacteriales bacterium]|jgi:hypothetical protein|nr:hypothetical protein [Coriobacteriales bacterium]